MYRKGSAEFADCLYIAIAAQAGRLPLWTPDTRAAKLSGAHSLGR